MKVEINTKKEGSESSKKIINMNVGECGKEDDQNNPSHKKSKSPNKQKPRINIIDEANNQKSKESQVAPYRKDEEDAKKVNPPEEPKKVSPSKLQLKEGKTESSLAKSPRSKREDIACFDIDASVKLNPYYNVLWKGLSQLNINLKHYPHYCECQGIIKSPHIVRSK